MATQFLIKGALTAISTLSIFLAAATRVSPSLLRLQQSLIQFRSSSGDATQAIYLINELMHFKLEISQSQTVANSAEPKGEIRVNHLFVRYNDSVQDCINDISFTVAPDTILAIVGASGHGKSTLMDLMMGALVPKLGSVTMDSLSPRSFISNFAGAVGYVARESVFTNAGVRGNLLLGLSADSFLDQLIWSVLSEVGLEKAVRALPGGLDGSVGKKS